MRFGFGPEDVWTLFHSHAFDFSVWEIWGALAYGGRLVVVPYVVSRSPDEFVELVVREDRTGRPGTLKAHLPRDVGVFAEPVEKVEIRIDAEGEGEERDLVYRVSFVPRENPARLTTRLRCRAIVPSNTPVAK